MWHSAPDTYPTEADVLAEGAATIAFYATQEPLKHFTGYRAVEVHDPAPAASLSLAPDEAGRLSVAREGGDLSVTGQATGQVTGQGVEPAHAAPRPWWRWFAR